MCSLGKEIKELAAGYGGFQGLQKYLRPPQPGCSRAARVPGPLRPGSPVMAGLLRGARAHATPEEGPPAHGLPHRARPAAFPRTPLLFILRSPAGLGVSERAAGPPSRPLSTSQPGPQRAMLYSRHPGNRAGSGSPPRGSGHAPRGVTSRPSTQAQCGRREGSGGGGACAVGSRPRPPPSLPRHWLSESAALGLGSAARSSS